MFTVKKKSVSIAIAAIFCGTTHASKLPSAIATNTQKYTLNLRWEKNPANNNQYSLLLRGLWPIKGNGIDGCPDINDKQKKKLEEKFEPVKKTMGGIVEGITAKKFNVGSEWVKHGHCTELGSKEYFEWSKLLFEGIKTPELVYAGGNYTAQTIANAFVESNSKLKSDSIHVNSENNPNTVFSGISICLNNELDYTTCNKVSDKSSPQKLLINPSLPKQKDTLNQNKNIHEPGKFDYYVLALSWSPAYCQLKPTDKEQCGIKTHYRFVIHGLWPKYNKGYPEFCKKNSPIDETITDKIFPIMPSKKLIADEWTKHGTCSGLDQATYFNYSATLYHELKFPEFVYKNNISTITAADIIKEFKKTNPSLAQQDSIRVVAKKQKGKEEVLQEIRVCYNKAFKPLTCPFPRLTNPNTRLEVIPPKGSNEEDDINKPVIPEKDKNITSKTINFNLACKLQIQENNPITLNCVKAKI